MSEVRFMTLQARVYRFLVRWGLLEHPYGEEYAQERFTGFGGDKDN